MRAKGSDCAKHAIYVVWAKLCRVQEHLRQNQYICEKGKLRKMLMSCTAARLPAGLQHTAKPPSCKKDYSQTTRRHALRPLQASASNMAHEYHKHSPFVGNLQQEENTMGLDAVLVQQPSAGESNLLHRQGHSSKQRPECAILALGNSWPSLCPGANSPSNVNSPRSVINRACLQSQSTSWRTPEPRCQQAGLILLM